MACDQIGTYSGSPNGFVTHVVSHDPDGSCQATKIGSDSPGSVSDEEVLARFVACPTHATNQVDGASQIDESLFQDMFSIGCSITRILEPGPCTNESLHAQGEAMSEAIRSGSGGRPPQPSRHYLGLVMLKAGDVRAVSVDSVPRRLRIYDTSHGPDDSLHGDIVASADGLNKVQRKELRVRLFKLAIDSGLFPSPHYAGGQNLSDFGLAIR